MGERGRFGGEAKRDRLRSVVAGRTCTLALRSTVLIGKRLGDCDMRETCNGVLESAPSSIEAEDAFSGLSRMACLKGDCGGRLAGLPRRDAPNNFVGDVEDFGARTEGLAGDGAVTFGGDGAAMSLVGLLSL